MTHSNEATSNGPCRSVVSLLAQTWKRHDRRRPRSRVVEICSVANMDIGEWLVRQGLAFDWPRYSRGKYAAAQHEAKQAERGIWSGSFVQPWDGAK